MDGVRNHERTSLLNTTSNLGVEVACIEGTHFKYLGVVGKFPQDFSIVAADVTFRRQNPTFDRM
jgi:hypothetical protein